MTLQISQRGKEYLKTVQTLLRTLDIVAPIGKDQRALIVAQPRTGKLEPTDSAGQPRIGEGRVV